ncbi:hypothetical protein C8R47DRAFT_1166531 [Mycena vitilis]|nr:hypothetical protein C8R47DRAFT_1166531 [Mycena vitilis]
MTLLFKDALCHAGARAAAADVGPLLSPALLSALCARTSVGCKTFRARKSALCNRNLGAASPGSPPIDPKNAHPLVPGCCRFCLCPEAAWLVPRCPELSHSNSWEDRASGIDRRKWPAGMLPVCCLGNLGPENAHALDKRRTEASGAPVARHRYEVISLPRFPLWTITALCIKGEWPWGESNTEVTELTGAINSLTPMNANAVAASSIHSSALATSAEVRNCTSIVAGIPGPFNELNTTSFLAALSSLQPSIRMALNALLDKKSLFGQIVIVGSTTAIAIVVVDLKTLQLGVDKFAVAAIAQCAADDRSKAVALQAQLDAALAGTIANMNS